MKRRCLLIGLQAGLLLFAIIQAKAADIRAEAIATIDSVGQKFVGLAEAIPEDRYAWRPGEGVRSVREVFLHVAAANYSLPAMIDFPTPEGVDPKEVTAVSRKSEVVESLKASFAHVRLALEEMPDEDLGKPLKAFGQERTYQGMMLFIIEHLGEHLGQSIAYARANGVVPPWSEPPPAPE